MSETPQVNDSEQDIQKTKKKQSKILKSTLELVSIVVLAMVISFVLKTYLVQTFYIPSESMQNTLQVNDRIIVNKLVSDEDDLNRGDVIVFKDTKKWLPPAQEENPNPIKKLMINIGISSNDTENYLVKRIIGMPGDNVKCCNADGKISINGQEIDEPYLYTGNAPSEREFDVTVPDGKVWVMGDHRSDSADSRSHQNLPSKGFIDIKDIQGRGSAIVWPIENFGSINSYSETFENVPAPEKTSN